MLCLMTGASELFSACLITCASELFSACLITGVSMASTWDNRDPGQ